ncbi:FAD-binding and (Fe-S)-binding domain-containing protein [Pseudoalteromonas sp. SSDWG2]|uniref:FAD-binding and (Fe-S)-binding domain-containing protein n=1 Tax=Pseudoalteromonas sp. SSDWG2 TaxID=3139391 RepID=UPI003BA86937
MSESHSALEAFISAVRCTLPDEQIINDYALRYALATDASFYRLTPDYVLIVNNSEQVQRILKSAHQYRVPVTFRAAGTSLSGQAISDSVLVMLSDDWQEIDIADDGSWVRVSSSWVGAKVNELLAPFGCKIGPDPASINTCKIGGIAANNASGMCCGVKHNSYHTLKDMTIIFADGTLLDTSDKHSIAAFRRTHANLVEGLESLAQQVRDNASLSELISHKYRLKNTTGYGLNSLVDFSDGIDIIKHLMIGSEGTLGFIADITYHTVADPKSKLTGLYTFDDIDTACAVVEKLSALPIAAVEMLDKRALLSVQDHEVMPKGINAFPLDATALLIEIAADDDQELAHIHSQVNELLNDYSEKIIHQYPLCDDSKRAMALWNVRKGTFPAVGAIRPTGTTVIIEDVAFALADLAKGIRALHGLFTQYGYDEAIIFGHALAGNLHFVFTQGFETQDDIARYDAFMADVAALVAIELKGSLKAEHGTGRNMAPFVALEWTQDGYEVMQRIKALFDSDNILNPGVIINADDKAHLRDLKSMPASDARIDTCIECGFCEPVCPSKGYTLTPRQRISLKRHEQQLVAQLTREPTPQVRTKLGAVQHAYQGLAVDSCAATGLCATRCPVGINTGDYIKSLRAKRPQHSAAIKAISQFSADHFAGAAALARVGLKSAELGAKLLGARRLTATTRWLNTRFGTPIYYSAWPHAQNRTASVAGQHHDQKVVYIPSCANRVFANDHKRSVQEIFYSLCHKADIEVLTPQRVEHLCCGMPWQSKGLEQESHAKLAQLEQVALALSEGGKWPVVMDASPCALKSQSMQKLDVLDSMEFAQAHLLPKLDPKVQNAPLWLHITCSSQHLDGGEAMLRVARALSNDVKTTAVSCCGFAGDKGFTHVQLNSHALRHLSHERPHACAKGYSNSRTCEIGLKEHSGVSFTSLLALLDEQT